MFVSPPLAAGWAARPYPRGPPPLCGAGGPRRQGVPGRHAPLPWLEDVVHVRAAHPPRQQPRGRSFRKCSQPEATAPRGALTAPLLSSGFQEGTAPPPHRSPPRPPPHAVGRAARCPGRSSPTGPCSPLQGPRGQPRQGPGTAMLLEPQVPCSAGAGTFPTTRGGRSPPPTPPLTTASTQSADSVGKLSSTSRSPGSPPWHCGLAGPSSQPSGLGLLTPPPALPSALRHLNQSGQAPSQMAGPQPPGL